MISTLVQPAFLWFYIATIFLIIELMAPGFIAIFFSLGCLAASLAAWLAQVGVAGQIAIFVAVTILSIFSLRKVCLNTFHGQQSPQEDQDNYAAQHIGSTVVVTKPITPDQQGEVKLAGSFWIAQAEVEMEVGENGLVSAIDPHNPLIVHVKPLQHNS